MTSYIFQLNLDNNLKFKNVSYLVEKKCNFKLYAIYLKDEALFAFVNNGIYMFKVPEGHKRLYFGITMQKFERRMTSHESCSNNNSYTQSQKLYNCIRAHGFNSFDKIIIEDFLTEEEAKASEIYHIEKYDTYYNGLNSTKGGDNIFSGADSKRACAVEVYNNITGEITHFDWQGAAADFLGVSSECVKAVVGNNNISKQTYSPIFDTYFQLRKKDDNTPFLENMTTPNKHIAEKKRKPIIVFNIETNEEKEFDGIDIAAMYFNIDRSLIKHVLSGRSRHFSVGMFKYDVQKNPKTRIWNCDILEKNKV